MAGKEEEEGGGVRKDKESSAGTGISYSSEDQPTL